GAFPLYFGRYGVILEAYGFGAAAVPVFLAGVGYAGEPSDALRALGFGGIRASLGAHLTEQAFSILDEAEKGRIGAPAWFWRSIRRQLTQPPAANTPQPGASAPPPGPSAPQPPGGATKPTP